MSVNSILKVLALVVFASLSLFLTGCGGGSQSNAGVSPKALSQVTIAPQTLSLPKGSSHQMTVTAVFSDGSRQDITASAVWSSTPPP